jgi:hypothetical protein
MLRYATLCYAMLRYATLGVERSSRLFLVGTHYGHFEVTCRQDAGHDVIGLLRILFGLLVMVGTDLCVYFLEIPISRAICDRTCSTVRQRSASCS